MKQLIKTTLIRTLWVAPLLAAGLAIGCAQAKVSKAPKTPPLKKRQRPAIVLLAKARKAILTKGLRKVRKAPSNGSGDN